MHCKMKKRNEIIYVVILAILVLGLLFEYIPGCESLGGFVSPPVALFSGLIFALVFGQAYPSFNQKMSKKLLQWSVVGLGFGMNVTEALQSGKDGMIFTIISVFGTLAIGWLIGRKMLKVDQRTSYLVSSGTAICGGSAIAAVGPVIGAKDSEMSVALGTVFILNAVALFIFPPIGHALGLTQQEFGTWAAIAIHDTSSVVGAGQTYGEEALQVATTIKLTRALWIVPVSLISSLIWNRKGDGNGNGKVSIPMFIIWFIVALLVNTYLLSRFDAGIVIGSTISTIARKVLTITLFFIGAGLTRQVLRSVGLRPLIQGILLWIVISCASLGYIFLIR